MNPGPPQYLVTLINFLIFVYIKKMVKFFLEKKLDMNIIKVLVNQQQQSYLYQMKQNLSKLKKKGKLCIWSQSFAPYFNLFSWLSKKYFNLFFNH